MISWYFLKIIFIIDHYRPLLMMPSSPFITYQLKICCKKTICVVIGRLGEFTFPAGDYVYTGSARRNTEARIARHLEHHTQKKFHWHIDYLLAASGVSIREVTRHRIEECLLNQATAGQIIVPRFGASDCQHACISHLKRVF